MIWDTPKSLSMETPKILGWDIVPESFAGALIVFLLSILIPFTDKTTAKIYVGFLIFFSVVSLTISILYLSNVNTFFSLKNESDEQIFMAIILLSIFLPFFSFKIKPYPFKEDLTSAVHKKVNQVISKTNRTNRIPVMNTQFKLLGEPKKALVAEKLPLEFLNWKDYQEEFKILQLPENKKEKNIRISDVRNVQESAKKWISGNKLQSIQKVCADLEKEYQMKVNENCYLVLGVPINTDFENVKKAYRKKVKNYHPDILLQLTAKERKTAEENFSIISRAYSRLEKMHQKSIGV